MITPSDSISDNSLLSNFFPLPKFTEVHRVRREGQDLHEASHRPGTAGAVRPVQAGLRRGQHHRQARHVRPEGQGQVAGVDGQEGNRPGRGQGGVHQACGGTERQVCVICGGSCKVNWGH